jgi:MFS family permease
MDRYGVSTSWIASSLDKHVLTWGSYFLTLTSFQPLYGRLSDIFGRKPALLFGYAVFGLGCLFCGLARNMNELIAARVRLQGCYILQNLD